MYRETEKFETYIGQHVFNRVKLRVYDKQGDEIYTLDMPPDVFKHILEIMTVFDSAYFTESK